MAEVKQPGSLDVQSGALTGTPGPTIARYEYDAIGRRINKQVMGPSGTLAYGRREFYYYDGHRLIEQYDSVDEPTVGGRGDPGLGTRTKKGPGRQRVVSNPAERSMRRTPQATSGWP